MCLVLKKVYNRLKNKDYEKIITLDELLQTSL